jgi:hypothetical protein
MIASGDLEGYRSQARATMTFDVQDRLGEIAVPVTIIHGELDAVASISSTIRSCAPLARMGLVLTVRKCLTSRPQGRRPATRQADTRSQTKISVSPGAITLAAPRLP